MNKKLIPFGILLLTLILLPTYLQAQGVKLKITVSRANIRESPSLNSSIISTLEQGTLLVSNLKEGDWYQVILQNEEGEKIGYIHENIVEVEEIIIEKEKEEKKPKEPSEKEKITTGETKRKNTGGEAVSWVLGEKSRDIEDRKEPEKQKKQSRKQLQADAGVLAGISLANLYAGEYEEFSSKLGFAVGGYLDIQLNKIIGIQPQILFSQKGGREDYYGNLESVYSFNYLELPILVKISFPNVISPFIVVGPSIGMNLFGHETIKAKEEQEGSDYKQKFNFSFNIFDIGIVGGVGVKLPITNQNKISLQARYGFDLFKIKSFGDLKNKNFLFLLGYEF